MSQANAQSSDADSESNEQESNSSEVGADDVCSQHGRGSVTPAVRAEVLERDGYRCRLCGRRDPAHGGVATLHVHHIERDPDDVAEDALVNLTTLCRPCHHSEHQRVTLEDAPVPMTDTDMTELAWDDNEILQYLAEEGPAQTSEIRDALTRDYSLTTVREHLAELMGLDKRVESREQQLIDRDVETGKWGLPDQIERSARGYVPSNPQEFLQRVEDEQVRQALARGCNRKEVEDVLDISRRSTFHKEKRAYAYDFPLDVYRRSGNGGQHPAGGTEDESSDDATAESERADLHQQLDTADTETKDASQAGFDAVSEVTGDTDGSERDSDAVDASLDEWNDIDPKLLKQLNRVIIEQLDCDE